MVSHEEEKFGIIQAMDNISPADISKSLSVEDNRRKVFQAGEGAGASGSFFFFSHDNRFIIKTMTPGERNRMLSMLDDYIAHIRVLKNKSLLARIYGIFTFTTNRFSPMDVMIMQNTAHTGTGSEVLKFDLKGSTMNRYVKIPPHNANFWRTSLDCSKVLKDMNFQEINGGLDHALLSLSRTQHAHLEEVLKKDSQFLRDHKLMDYSLLLVIESIPIDTLNSLSDKSINKK
jgi:hypothetical protein